jgi:hypothetical protein
MIVLAGFLWESSTLLILAGRRDRCIELSTTGLGFVDFVFGQLTLGVYIVIYWACAEVKSPAPIKNEAGMFP